MSLHRNASSRPTVNPSAATADSTNTTTTTGTTGPTSGGGGGAGDCNDIKNLVRRWKQQRELLEDCEESTNAAREDVAALRTELKQQQAEWHTTRAEIQAAVTKTTEDTATSTRDVVALEEAAAALATRNEDQRHKNAHALALLHGARNDIEMRRRQREAQDAEPLAALTTERTLRAESLGQLELAAQRLRETLPADASAQAALIAELRQKLRTTEITRAKEAKAWQQERERRRRELVVNDYRALSEDLGESSRAHRRLASVIDSGATLEQSAGGAREEVRRLREWMTTLAPLPM